MSENQLLRDQNIPPTSEIIAEGLGESNYAFVQFLSGLKQYGITLMDWRYYNDGKAWLSKGEYKWVTARGTQKVKPIFWLSIWDGFFKVSYFFSESIKDELLALPISSAAKEIIENATSLGKTQRFMPIIFDVTSDTQLNDVHLIAEFRKTKVK